MPTLTQESATKALFDTQQQHDLVAQQLASVVSDLATVAPGSRGHAELSIRAASLQDNLNKIETALALLKPQSQDEAKRAELEAQAQAQAQAELEEKAQADLAHVQKLAETINKCSDVIAAAIQDLATGDYWASQRAVGGPSLDTVNRSLRRIIDEIPMVNITPMRVSVRRRAENGKGYRPVA